MAMRIEAARCTNCGECLSECPNEGIVEVDGAYHVQSGYCTECFGIHERPVCAEVCPADAVEPDPEWLDDELALAARAAELTPGHFPRD